MDEVLRDRIEAETERGWGLLYTKWAGYPNPIDELNARNIQWLSGEKIEYIEYGFAPNERNSPIASDLLFGFILSTRFAVLHKIPKPKDTRELGMFEWKFMARNMISALDTVWLGKSHADSIMQIRATYGDGDDVLIPRADLTWTATKYDETSRIFLKLRDDLYPRQCPCPKERLLRMRL